MRCAVKPVYFCDYCPKKRFTKKGMESHEKFCKNNPNNGHDCFFCPHLKKIEPKENGFRGTQFSCKLLNKKLYSYVAEKRKLLTKHPSSFTDAVRMPTICEVRGMSKKEFKDYTAESLAAQSVQDWLNKEGKN